MRLQTVKSKSSILYSLILSSLIILSSQSPIPKRFLQYEPSEDINQANNTNSTDDSTSVTEDPGAYLLAWFVIFFLLELI